jgi:hypothetical protein
MELKAVIYGTVADRNKASLDALVVDLASAVRNELTLASTAGDGYSRTFSVPDVLISQPYTISFNASTVYVRTTDGKHAVALPIVNVTGQVKKGANTIRNVNGTIILN